MWFQNPDLLSHLKHRLYAYLAKKSQQEKGKCFEISIGKILSEGVRLSDS